jgi:sensor domain CHASE-containing protein
MKLRPKIVSLILAVFLGYLAASFLIQRLIILPSFVALEEEKATKNVERCREAIIREIEHLKVQCHDWASWNETYDFVIDQNETYITNNLLLEAFENTQLNMMYFISNDGRLVWGKVYDLSGEEALEIDPVIGDLSGYPMAMRHDVPDSGATGIISTRHGPMLIASLPILTNENEGPIHGSLVMGRFITEETVSLIAEQTRVDFDLWALGDPAIPEADRLAVAQIGPDEQVMLRESKDELTGYSVYHDMNGRPILLIRAYLPKEIVARGAAAMHIATLSICVAGLVTMLLLLIALQRMVIDPLGRLTRHAGEVGNTSNLTTRIAMNRPDEIGTLADTLDRMVDQLSESRTALSEASRAAGKADVASRVLHNVGNVLNSVNVSAATALQGLGDLPVDDLRKVVAMLRDHADDPGSYLTEDPRGRLVPAFLDELSEKMAEDRGQLTKELQTLTEQINHIKSVVATQQEFSRTSKVEVIGSIQKVVDDAIVINNEQPWGSCSL